MFILTIQISTDHFQRHAALTLLLFMLKVFKQMSNEG